MSYSLLVIDDQDAILHAFRRAFRNSECTLTTASTATEGLKAAREMKPDVVVLDVHLPDASGLDLFQNIRDLDARKVEWKKFHEINFVNIDYKLFDASGWPAMDSGLLGPVKLLVTAKP